MKNREQILKQQREYNKENKEQISKRNKKYTDSHKKEKHYMIKIIIKFIKKKEVKKKN